MKKTLLIIGLIIPICTVMLMNLSNKSYSASELPHEEPLTCSDEYENAISALEIEWDRQLQTIMDQEKPASDMVSEAFESLRSYKCMMEYVCRAVQYSGWGNPETIGPNGITSDHIGRIPGCQEPEDVGLPSGAWVIFMEIVSAGYSDIEWNYNKIPFFPKCMSPSKETQQQMRVSNANYDTCMAYIEKKLACLNNEDTGSSPKECTNKSISFVKIETALKEKSGDQKASAFERKLSSILTKMLAMESHATYLQSKLEQFDARYACSPSECN